MRLTLFAALAVTTAVALQAPPGQAADFSPHVKRVLETYIRPATTAFAETSAALPAATDALCAAPSDQTREAFSSSYTKTLEALGHVTFLRFGPLIQDHRLERLAFLPDARNIAQRQIRKALADNDGTLGDPATLAGKSVALQGLTALQLIAYDSDSNLTLGEGGGKAELCVYAGAIASNVTSIAGAIASEWKDPDGFSKQFLTAGPDNPQFRSSKEAIETIFNSMVTGLIVIKDQELLPALGTDKDNAKPNKLPFSRSGNATAYIAAELEGIRDAMNAAKLEPDLDSDAEWIPGSLNFEFGNAANNLRSLNGPLRQTMEEGGTYDKLNLVAIQVNSLRDTMALNLAGGLGLSGGFNALDGD
ncbi:imelysin family protein [Roseibium litorale]|uniref:Imelysin family protein n=1 Tax=Roseibium litorale TaxID=2803841 RepID=A0ABR9CMQ1_9HYPH|nr:imelysin family protein [Roseibium litorale]MBD8891700.1 imelysin family protein [Roseibium litorale]